MRVFDNPNDPHYGPVRRMWIVLAQLNMLDSAERWSDYQEDTRNTASGLRWDAWLAGCLTENPHIGESEYQRFLLSILLEGWL